MPGQGKIREIKENKKQYLDLLLMADEQEDMIEQYLGRGTMYVLDDNGVKAECVVTDESSGVLELKTSLWNRRFRGKDMGKLCWTSLFKPMRYCR